MSRLVSPSNQGHQPNSAHEHQPSPPCPFLPAGDGSSLSEERHVIDIEKLSSSGLQDLTSNAAKTYTRTISEHMKAAIYKFMEFLLKNETVRRTYWTAVALGLITTVYYICVLFIQDRANSIAVRRAAIAEESKKTADGLAAAAFIINCHTIRVSGHQLQFCRDHLLLMS
jgi:hypothetical protein